MDCEKIANIFTPVVCEFVAFLIILLLRLLCLGNRSRITTEMIQIHYPYMTTSTIMWVLVCVCVCLCFVVYY